MQAHLARGDRVIVLSASPTFYLAPFLREISPDVEVHGSGVDESNGVRVTNLYGKAKAAIAGGLIADSQPDETHVYTDHRHDLALMKLADRTTLVGPNKATVAAVDDAGLTYEIWLP
jgi:phosphoserine phosphatase